MRFLDPKKTIFTCTRTDCSGCEIKDEVTCHFSQGQLIKFLVVAFPAFIIGGIGSYLFAWWALLIFIALIFAYFLFTEIRVMCSHCPHYAEPSTRTLTCWANYGAPKIWKYRPGPMSFWEKLIFLTGMFVVFTAPILFMVLGEHFIMLAVYIFFLLFGLAMLFSFLCTRCMNFACPFNRVKSDMREKFFALNPRVKNAWKDKNRQKEYL